MKPLPMVQVCLAHAVSHIHIMLIPALVPLLPERYGLGFLDIGFAITLFALASLVAHIPLGHLTDRIGPRPVLVAGLCLGSLSLGSLAFSDSYAWLLVVMILAGIANGVYHPGGYALISREVDPAVAGRAFLIYTFSGFLGSAVTPALVYALLAAGGLPLVFAVLGGIGLPVALMFGVRPRAVGTARPASSSDNAGPVRVMSLRVLVLTCVFGLLSLLAVGTQNFSAAALTEGYGVDLALANLALSALLFASAAGVLVGGRASDGISRPGRAAAISLAVLAAAAMAISGVDLPPAAIVVLMAIIGFAFGFIAPSRDLLVRAAAPKGAEGRVFAIVSTGFNAGGAVGPLFFGFLMDHGQPWHVFAVAALIALAAAAVTVRD